MDTIPEKYLIFFGGGHFNVTQNYKVREMDLTQSLLLWTWISLVGKNKQNGLMYLFRFWKTERREVMRNAAFFSGAGVISLFERVLVPCPLSFLDMSMAEGYSTWSLVDSLLSSFHQGLMSQLRNLWIKTWSWLTAKSSQPDSNFIFSFVWQ